MKQFLMVLVILWVSTVSAVSKNSTSEAQKKDSANVRLELLYHEAQREFSNANYDKALALFEDYLKMGKKGLNKEERLFWVIDQIGYIFLRVKKDPEGAKKFLKRFEADSRLNSAQSDIILEWIGVADDWKKEKDKPQKIKSAEKLFSLGKKYFDRGLKKKKFPMDDKGNADLAIAETYFRPFIIHHDSDDRIGDVLFMMGRVKFNLRTDMNFWSENYYLKEVIRRFPGTKLSKQAFEKLNTDVHMGYSGSSGDHTPMSVRRMLELYKKMAHLKVTEELRK